MNTRYEQIKIKPAGKEDLASLMDIGYTTFYETFAENNRAEDMAVYLAEQFHIEYITEEFRNEKNKFLLGMKDGELIAYAKIREGSTAGDLPAEKVMEIERIYVLKAFQGQKAGLALMQYIMDYALQKHFETIWLGVWEHNVKAIGFYKHLGFEVFGSHVFMLGTDAQNDLLMKKELGNLKQ